MTNKKYQRPKKRGIKKGTYLIDKAEIQLKIGKVVTLMAYGGEATDPRNIADGVNGRFSFEQACREVGYSTSGFKNVLYTHPELKQRYTELREASRENMRAMAEHNIDRALSGQMKSLSEKDIVDTSFRLLEKTDKAYNPKQIVEATIEEIDLSTSTEDIMAELTKILKH